MTPEQKVLLYLKKMQGPKKTTDPRSNYGSLSALHEIAPLADDSSLRAWGFFEPLRNTEKGWLKGTRLDRWKHSTH